MNYKWKFKDYPQEKNEYTVFSCFSCGGGSTMGYKLAGFDVIGNCEIDKKINKVYVNNHHPEFNYECPVIDLIDRKLPDELYNLDILDGSPPCSAFSMAGLRESVWGKKKKFSEGQEEQILDRLFFDFINLVDKLQPKIVISENVVGITLGKAKKYIEEIYKSFDKAGYHTTHYILDSSLMGVPQKRKRVFFISYRKNLKFNNMTSDLFGNKYKNISMKFNEVVIPVSKFITYKERGKNANYLIKRFGDVVVNENLPLSTITTRTRFWNQNKDKFLSDESVILASTFPIDYNFGKVPIMYLTGMSVPPLMMYNIAKRIKRELLDEIILK